MEIVYAAAEAAPFYKVGGLADVMGSLPYEMASLGHKVKIFIPYYSSIKSTPDFMGTNEEIGFDLFHILHKEVDVYFIKNDTHFKEKAYSGNDAEDSRRFSFFSRAVIASFEMVGFTPDVVHSNDWHTGFIPIYLRNSDIKSFFSIHNMAFQGILHRDLMTELELPQELFTVDYLEYYNNINIMKGAIVFSDYTITVSPTYAKEITSTELGFGLEGLLSSPQVKLKGILNGIDCDLFDPSTDNSIASKYDSTNTYGKYKCKETIQAEFGFDRNPNIPLFGMVTRLFEQKGIDITLDALDTLLKKSIQVVILGSGKPSYENRLHSLEKKYRGKIKTIIGFDLNLAQRIYAGCDFYLMPSKFEPCGLSQLIALRYGTIPIVRATGGLKDTVTEEFNGFLFQNYDSLEFVAAVKRGLKYYQDRYKWETLVANAMESDFSWRQSALEYEKLYK